MKKPVSENEGSMVSPDASIYLDPKNLEKDDDFDNLHVSSITLSNMLQYKADTTTGIAVRDTIVVPGRDNASVREALLIQREWPSLQMDRAKLPRIQYMAVYFGAPTSAITHYAHIEGYVEDPRDSRKVILKLSSPQELPAPVICTKSICRPRYTTLALLMQARTSDELF